MPSTAPRESRYSNRTHRAPEPLVVLTADLKPFVDEYIEQHELAHPRREKLQRKVYGDNSKHNWTAERSFVTETGVPYGWFVRVRHLTRPYIPMGVADEILLGLQRSFVLGYAVPVYLNPEWSKDRVYASLRRRGVLLSEPFWHELDVANAA